MGILRADLITGAQVRTTGLTAVLNSVPTTALKLDRTTTFNLTITAPTVHRVTPTKTIPVRTPGAENNLRTADINSISNPATLTAQVGSGASLRGQASIKA